MKSPTKPHSSICNGNLSFPYSTFCILLLFCLLGIYIEFLIENASQERFRLDYGYNLPTYINHIVFGIASNKYSWPKRKDYVRLWWRPHKMRGCVFLDAQVNNTNFSNDTSIPPICISGDTSRFPYTWRSRWGSHGSRSAIRVARVVTETVALNLTDVRWFVFGDDDTIFFPDSLVTTLSKYDHRLWYYIGANSESHVQNKYFSFNMAFGGGGFAISYPLAKVLAKVFDSCLERYPHLYGSDGRIYACLAELGVGLTRESGFHQMDIRGSMFGLLASHPLTPLVSLHHIDHTDPIFPGMTRTKALEHLYQVSNVDPQRILQQTICYDRRYSWTISISWGYSVQIFNKHIFLPDVLRTQQTFQPWNSGNPLKMYSFNVRQHHPDPCQRPTTFFFDGISSWRNGVKTHYKQLRENCTVDMASPRKYEEIRVWTQRSLTNLRKFQAPRRQCCDVLPHLVEGNIMQIDIRECQEDELIFMH